jgi:hypothetical protein
MKSGRRQPPCRYLCDIVLHCQEHQYQNRRRTREELFATAKTKLAPTRGIICCSGARDSVVLKILAAVKVECWSPAPAEQDR